MLPDPRLATALVAAVFAAGCGSDTMTGVSPPGVQPPVSGRQDIVAGEVLVQFRAGLAAAPAAQALGYAIARHGYQNRFEVLDVGAGNELAAVTELRRDGRVAVAEPNYLLRPQTINPKLWAFYNPGGRKLRDLSGVVIPGYGSKSDADIDNVEGYAAAGADVVVADVDTGVDMTHPEFTGRLIADSDYVYFDNDPQDNVGHGSHTAGIMAGSTVGVAGVSGAAAHVRVLVSKVCRPYPELSGLVGCPNDAVIAAILRAADYPGMVAINLSLGSPDSSYFQHLAVNYAVKTKRVLVISAAGNDGTNVIGYPARFPEAISVAAINWKGQRTYYSNYGPGLDIAAPGGELYLDAASTTGIYSAWRNGGYTWQQGTSMAAPMVTGAAAIVASKTGLRGAALRTRLLTTTDDLGAVGYDRSFGNGRLNAYRAVTLVTLPTPQ